MSMSVKVVGADAASTTNGVADELVVCAGLSKLYTVSAFNNTAGVLYLQAHDAASKADAAADDKPKLVTAVYPSLSGGFNFSDGAVFTDGIYLCFSSTATTITLPGGANAGIIDASYRKA